VTSTIQPDHILRELTELWVSLGKESQPGHSTGVLRACAMTLVVTAEESEDPAVVGETIAALMREHPSRAIVIRFREAAARELSARVYAQCWMPFGQRRQICCEQIEISASEGSLPDLAAVIVPLAVSDLPLIVWCRSARIFNLPDFPLLGNVAQKVVLDSSAFPSASEFFRQLAARWRSGPVFADLAWTRLTRWREMISQIFENRKYLMRLPDVSEVRISFGGATPPSEAFYLAAWLTDCLETVGARSRVVWQPEAQASHAKISGVQLIADGPEGLSVAVHVTGEGENQMSEIQIDSLSSRTIFPQATDYVLLREELSIPGRDPVYERVLARATRLAVT
jgi:glucose-6-phosphate dehydrogenase assembly protein OpcA